MQIKWSPVRYSGESHQKGPNTDKHTNNPDASSVCNLPRKVATPLKMRLATGGSGKPLTSPK